MICVCQWTMIVIVIQDRINLACVHRLLGAKHLNTLLELSVIALWNVVPKVLCENLSSSYFKVNIEKLLQKRYLVAKYWVWFVDACDFCLCFCNVFSLFNIIKKNFRIWYRKIYIKNYKSCNYSKRFILYAYLFNKIMYYYGQGYVK
jgi:hypothetical protein